MQIEQTSISPFWPIAKWTMVALTAVSVLTNIFFYFANSYEWLTVRSVYYILDSLLFLAATVLMFFFAPARMMRFAGAAFAIGNILFVILGYVGNYMDSYITTVLRGIAALVMLSGFAAIYTCSGRYDIGRSVKFATCAYYFSYFIGLAYSFPIINHTGNFMSELVGINMSASNFIAVLIYKIAVCIMWYSIARHMNGPEINEDTEASDRKLKRLVSVMGSLVAFSMIFVFIMAYINEEFYH